MTKRYIEYVVPWKEPETTKYRFTKYILVIELISS